MARDELPEDVLRFLDACIDSVEQLRVLLLLFAGPERAWTTAEITTELRSAEASIAKRLDDLYGRRVLARLPELKGLHKFSPATPDVAGLVERLEAENRLRPYRVIESIYARPDKALKEFADAFKLRGDNS